MEAATVQAASASWRQWNVHMGWADSEVRSMQCGSSTLTLGSRCEGQLGSCSSIRHAPGAGMAGRQRTQVGATLRPALKRSNVELLMAVPRCVRTVALLLHRSQEAQQGSI
jgi:hypothetical protein